MLAGNLGTSWHVTASADHDMFPLQFHLLCEAADASEYI